MVGRLTMVRKSRYAGALGALPEAVEGLRSLAAEELTSIGRGVFTLTLLILLMAEILHQLIGSLSHYLQGLLIHPRWLFGISAINSIFGVF